MEKQEFDYELFKKLRYRRSIDLGNSLGEIKELERDEDSLKRMQEQEVYLKIHPELLLKEGVLTNGWPVYHRNIPASTIARIDKLHAKGIIFSSFSFEVVFEASEPIHLRMFFWDPTHEKPILNFITEKVKEFKPSDYYSSPWVKGSLEGKLYLDDPFFKYALHNVYRWYNEDKLPEDLTEFMKDKKWPEKEY